MAKSKDLTLSDVGFGNKVLINGHVYTYQGQDKRRTSDGIKTVYIFKMVDTSKVAEEFLEKTFDITANLRIRSVVLFAAVSYVRFGVSFACCPVAYA